MKLIHTKKFNQALESTLHHHFSIKERGFFLITITASARSWWQNTKTGRSFLKKDSLTVIINKERIVSFAGKKRLFASDIWNGNVLKGYDLTCYVLIQLPVGEHTCSFITHGKPYLGEISVFSVSDGEIILENLQPSHRDRIPWLTFIIGGGISIGSISVIASAGKYQRDDDDMRLLINGVTEANDQKNAHHDWYWCGKILKGSSKLFARNFEQKSPPQRIDFDADGTPTLSELRLAFFTGAQFSSSLLPRQYKPGSRGEDYNTYDRLIGKTVHFWNGEFSKTKQPVPIPLDPSLVKAIAYVESRLGYGANTVRYPASPDIMQVGDPRNPAIHTLRSEKDFEEREWDDGKKKSVPLAFDKAVEVRSAEESIYWGVRWLYHKAQYVKDNKRQWREWDEAVLGYHKKGDTRYRNNVMKIFKEGVDPRGMPLFVFLLLGTILTFVGGGVLSEMRRNTRGDELDAIHHIMKNRSYRIENKKILLVDGFFSYRNALDDSAAESIRSYDDYDGPYYVRYTSSAFGDLNHDGMQDAIAVLGVSYGGTGYYIHLTALLQQGDGTYQNAGSYVLNDRDEIKNIIIRNEYVILDALVHGPHDPGCCPSHSIKRKINLTMFQ